MSEPLRVLLLGPLEAFVGGRRVGLEGEQRSRMLVAVLALRPNESVRRDALIEAIWGDAPPGSASPRLTTWFRAYRRGPLDRVARLTPSQESKV